MGGVGIAAQSIHQDNAGKDRGCKMIRFGNIVISRSTKTITNGKKTYQWHGTSRRCEFRLMEALEAGMIGINDGVPSTSNCPFGGVKQSGWGRELGLEGIEAFMETKHISLGLQI